MNRNVFNPRDRIFDIKGLTVELNMDKKSVYKLLQNKQITGRKFPGRIGWRVHEQAVRDYLLGQDTGID